MSQLDQVAAQAQQKPALSALQDPRSTPAPPIKAEAKETDNPFVLDEVVKSLHVYRPAPLKKNQKIEGALEGITPPRVVLLLGWMDAPLSLLLKYAKPYATLLPQSTILIKLSNAKSHMNTAKSVSLKAVQRLLAEEAAKESQRRKLREEMGRVEATRSALRLDTEHREQDEQAIGDSTITLVGNENSIEQMKPPQDKEAEAEAPPPSAPPSLPAQPHGLLIHSFSDGGGNNLAYLLSSSALPLSVRATIFDSSPSQGRAWEGATAFTIPLSARSRPWIVRVLLRQSLRVIIYLVLRLLLLAKKLSGQETRNEKMRIALNDPRLWTRKALQETAEEEVGQSVPPRLYLYSKADTLVPYDAVEAHAREWATAQEVSPPKAIDMEGPTAKQNSKEKMSYPSGAGSIVLRRWNDAPHCAIGRYDAEGYWDEVKSFLGQHLKTS